MDRRAAAIAFLSPVWIRGFGDAMGHGCDAASDTSQPHWVELVWVGGEGAPGSLHHFPGAGRLGTKGFRGLRTRAQKTQCGSLIQLFTGLQSSPRLVLLGASWPRRFGAWRVVAGAELACSAAGWWFGEAGVGSCCILAAWKFQPFGEAGPPWSDAWWPENQIKDCIPGEWNRG